LIIFLNRFVRLFKLFFFFLLSTIDIIKKKQLIISNMKAFACNIFFALVYIHIFLSYLVFFPFFFHSSFKSLGHFLLFTLHHSRFKSGEYSIQAWQVALVAKVLEKCERMGDRKREREREREKTKKRNKHSYLVNVCFLCRRFY
jgi:hypothetical protein